MAWAIEQGLQPVEIDRLRKYGCIPGRLMPATYARLFNALAAWQLSDDDRVRRIDSWRCGGPVAPPPRPAPRPSTRAKAAPRSSAAGRAGAAAKASPKAAASGTLSGAMASGRSGTAKAAPGGSPPPSTAAGGVYTNSAGFAVRIPPQAGRPPAAAPAPTPAPAAAPVPAAAVRADTAVLLSVLSNLTSLPVSVNRVPVGRTPIALQVPRGRLAYITVGEGALRRDTTLFVTGRHDLVVTVERGRGGRGDAGAGGAPVAAASALSRTSIEAEMAAILPPVPREPFLPVMVSPREARTDLYWSLAVTGVAALASSRHCRQQATSPQPYGGTYTGTYHPAGTFVPSAFMLCTSAIGVAAGAASFPIFRIFSRFANEGARSRFLVDSASYPQRRAAYVQVRQLRQAMVDSAFFQRQQEAGAPVELRWRVDTLPRRLP